jgi:hypothetical protein
VRPPSLYVTCRGHDAGAVLKKAQRNAQSRSTVVIVSRSERGKTRSGSMSRWFRGVASHEPECGKARQPPAWMACRRSIGEVTEASGSMALPPVRAATVLTDAKVRPDTEKRKSVIEVCQFALV